MSYVVAAVDDKGPVSTNVRTINNAIDFGDRLSADGYWNVAITFADGTKWTLSELRVCAGGVSVGSV